MENKSSFLKQSKLKKKKTNQKMFIDKNNNCSVSKNNLKF